jgi:ferritin-like metal-binding protein YciE
MKDFNTLFVEELKRIYSAETQIVSALPSMIQAATNSKLKEAFQHHLGETKEQIMRLEEIAQEVNENLSSVRECEITKALINEGKKVMQSDYDANTKDAALINCAQRIEHYEIASYGILKAYAKQLKLSRVEKLLKDSAKEEGCSNKVLTDIAEGTLFSTGVNVQAKKRAA